MKAKANTFQQKPTFAPKPLTPEQLNAIDLLITGKSDQDVADAIGRDRTTLWAWKTRLPYFMATLEVRRQEQFGQASQRLRNVLGKAISNVESAVALGNLTVSLAVIKATGLERVDPPTGETDVERIAKRICLEQLQNESIPEKDDFLLSLGRNPRYDQRQQEILDELGRNELGE